MWEVLQVHYSNQELYDFTGDRTQQILDFLSAGWGCIRKQDILSMFRITKTDFQHVIRYMQSNHITLIEKDDFCYIEFYADYQPPTKYMNAFSVLTSIAQKHQQCKITIVDDVYSNLFVAKMFLHTPNTEELRTYYVLDTALVSMPFYALQEVLLAEISDNGFQQTNKIVMVVYEDTNVEYIDIPYPLFYALLLQKEHGVYTEFYNNQLKED